MPRAATTPATPADPLVDVVVRVQRDPISGKRCGYPELLVPAGYCDEHPNGEGNFRDDHWRCSPCQYSVFQKSDPGRCPTCGANMRLVPERRIIRGPTSVFGPDKLWRWERGEEHVERAGTLKSGMPLWAFTDVYTGRVSILPSEREPHPGKLTRCVPLVRFDAGRLLARTGLDKPQVSSKLMNVVGPAAAAILSASYEEARAFEDAFNSRRAAIVTVGTGKDQATIQGGVNASSSGDTVAVYAGGVGDVYTENVTLAGKVINLEGTIATQGVTIKSAGSHVLTATANAAIRNFTIDGTGGGAGSDGIGLSPAAAGQYTTVQDCVVRNAVDEGVYAGTSTICLTINTLIHSCGGDGFYGGFGDRAQATHVTSANNGGKGFGGNGQEAICKFCLGSGNTGADFDHNAAYSRNNVSEDGTATGSGSVTGFVHTDLDAANDYRLKAAVAATTKARIAGLPIFARDVDAQTRKTTGIVFAGASDPDPYYDPVESDVKLGVVYDGGYVGTYVGSAPPSTPAASFGDQADGTGAGCVITGSDGAATNEVWVTSDGMTWTSMGTSVGDGTIDCVLEDGNYWGYIESTDAGGAAISEIHYFSVTDGSTTGVADGASMLIQTHGEELTHNRELATRDAVRGRRSTWHEIGKFYGWIQATSAMESWDWQQRGLNVTHKCFTSDDPDLQEGDQLVTSDGRKMVVRGPVNQAGLNRVWRINLEEML